MRFTGCTRLAMAAAGVAAFPAFAQTQDDFFDNSYVHEIRLTVRPSDWPSCNKIISTIRTIPLTSTGILRGKTFPF